ncbi:MAG TPA: beta-galactosidase [Thermoclostridium sp.]|nr:beta-galactosidase [Thermoclostridium sp.]
MQEIHLVLPNTKADTPEIIMHGKDKRGNEVAVNRRYFTLNGLPWIPITGEFHFARYPHQYWKQALQRIKAGGLDIVATYIFWIHHEEIEGKFKWDKSFNLRRFVELCEDVGLKVILRIGPWCHGEVRNGGYPDWLYKKNMEPGTNNPIYFDYVKKLYSQIYSQVDGLLYKDNGPIVGIQIDNEYGHCHGLSGDAGMEHMMALKKMAMKIGFDVPFYTATGWGGAIVVEDEFIPTLGTYVEGSWEQHIDKIPPNINHVFTSIRDDQSVGSDLSVSKGYKTTYNINNYPFATCELGGGMQCNSQRRPIITADDTGAMAFVKLGSGATMLGYYMYHGGTNPVGELSTFEENRATGSPNDLPILSYDYQAPLGEYGQSHPSYHALRRLHLFVKSQDSFLAQSYSYILNDRKVKPDDTAKIRCAVRHLHGSGFLFINNHQHNLKMTPKNNLKFSVEVEGGVITFPEISLKSGQWRLLPFNQDLNGILLKSATTQPLTSISCQTSQYYFYYGEPEQHIEYSFDSQTVKRVISGGIAVEDGSHVVVKQDFANTGIYLEPVVLENMQGNKVYIVSLTKEQANDFYLFELDCQPYALISQMDLFMDGQQIQGVLTGKDSTEIHAFPKLPEKQKIHRHDVNKKVSIFNQYRIKWKSVKPKVSLEYKGLSRDGHLQYFILVDDSFMDGCSDVFLNIDFEGDIAQITHNGKLMADFFYTGLTWRIGLKRFIHLLNTGEWVLDISPLFNDAYVYLDKWPRMIDGKALRLVDYSVVPEYRIF